MKTAVLWTLVATIHVAYIALAAAELSSTGTLVTPVQKVIEMLNGMLTKGKQEKHDEQVQFATYKQFCADTMAEKTSAVKEAGEEIELLQANIQMAETDAATYGKKAEELNTDIASWSADEKAATKVRDIERNDYMKAHKEYSDTIDAITKAFQVLQAQAGNKAQAQSVSLLMGTKGLDRVPEARRVLAAFLSNIAAADPPSPPEAYAYEFRSTSILDMLQKLKDKFIDERTTLEKEEMSKRHAYELLAQDLKKSVTAAEEAVSQKVQQKAKQLQQAASMKGQLEDATSTRSGDQKYLTEVTATCKQKEADYEDRQKLRAEEIVAIEKALEILSSDKVMGTSAKYLGLLQVSRRRGTALAQTRASGRSPTQMRVAQYLDHRAEHLNSRVLSTLAVRVREDPFSKVKKMIQDLIMRLMEEAGEEAQHKTWCDTELASNEQARNSRSVDVERLTGEIDNLKSSIAELSLQLTETAKQVSETDKQMATQTDIRQKEKAENEQTLKDAREAQTAIGQAVTVLKEFYDRTAEATALVQDRKHRQTPPPIFDGAYQGMGTENGGVVAMLEVIQSDYARLESTTSAMEVTSQQDFDKQMSDTAVLKAQLEKDTEHKTRLKQTNEQSLVDRTNDLTSSQKELDAANNYYEKLKPSCLDAGMSFQERTQRRQEEIESLQEALRILNGEDLAVP